MGKPNSRMPDSMCQSTRPVFTAQRTPLRSQRDEGLEESGETGGVAAVVDQGAVEVRAQQFDH